MTKLFFKLLFAFSGVLLVSVIMFSLIAAFAHHISQEVKTLAEVTHPKHQHSAELISGAYLSWLGGFLYANGDSAFGRQFIFEGNELMKENANILKNLGVETKEIEYKKTTAIDEQNKVLDLISRNITGEQLKFALNILQQRMSALNLEIESVTCSKL